MQELFEKCMLLIYLFVQRLIDRSKLISQRIPEIEQSVATFVFRKYNAKSTRYNHSYSLDTILNI